MPNAALDNLFSTSPALPPAGATAAPAIGAGREFDDALRRAGQGAAATPGGKRAVAHRRGNETDANAAPRDDSRATSADQAASGNHQPANAATQSRTHDGDPNQDERRKDEPNNSADTQTVDGTSAAAQPGPHSITPVAPTTDDAGADSAITQITLIADATTTLIESQVQVASTPNSTTAAGEAATSIPTTDAEASLTVQLADVSATAPDDLAKPLADVPAQLDPAFHAIEPSTELSASDSTAASPPNDSQHADAGQEPLTVEQPHKLSAEVVQANVALPDKAAGGERPIQPPRRTHQTLLDEAATEDSKLAPQQDVSLLSVSTAVAPAPSPEVTTRADAGRSDDPSQDSRAQAAANQSAALSDNSSSDMLRAAAANSPARLSQGSSTRKSSALGQPTSSSPVDQARFVQRVAKAFHTADSQGGQIRLRLSPPELGSMKLEVAVRNGVMTARLEAETPAARTLLLDNLPALRDRLANQNIKIERFDVDLKQDGRGDGSPQPPPDFTGSRQNSPRPQQLGRMGTAGHEAAESPLPGGIPAVGGASGQINVVI